MSDESAQSPDNAEPSPAADPQSIEGLFVAALGHASTAEREAFLDEACGDDAERRRRIEALLRAYEDAGSFLEKPPVGASSAETISLEFLSPSDDPGLLGMLGPYEVYEVLGRGGMGIVFRARDPKLNRVVAIKVLAPELAANPNARRRFLREAQAAAAISHPHVVTIHAVDEGSTAGSAQDGGNPVSSLPFLVMECIVGQTLQQKLDKQGSLRLMEILRIGHQVACGLAAAHKQGLIHRDIKPANILLENGVERVKITDFGLARAADDVSITRTGEVSGTPQYMSPEQASGDAVDHRSDLFSLGSVLYAMCTGRSPFRATTLAAAIRRVCDDTPRPIEEINAEVPPWLIEIVNRLLAKNPGERIQSADEVADLLGDRLAGIQQPGTFRGRVESDRSPQPSHARGTRPLAPPTSQQPAQRPTPDTSGQQPAMPGWLVTPLPGPFKVIALLVFVAASLVLGQAMEQWDRDAGNIAASLFLAAILLGWLAGQLALAAGVSFRNGRWQAFGLATLPLIYLGAEGPGEPFKRELTAHWELIAWLTVMLFLAMLPASALFWGLSQTGEAGRTRRDELGSAMIWGNVAVWGGLVLWLLLVGVGAISPPPFASREKIDGPIILTFAFGALLLVVGVILKRYVVTPGMVRQVSTATSPAGTKAHDFQNPSNSTPTSPWRVLGWMIVGGLVLIPGCLIMTWMAYQGVGQNGSKGPFGILQVEFDSARPVTRIHAQGDIGAALSEQKVTEHLVSSNPFKLPLPPGVYDFTMTYQADGRTGKFIKRTQIYPGRTKRLDVTQDVAVSHQMQHLDQPLFEKDGNPPARVIPLSDTTMSDDRSSQAEVNITFDDAGLKVLLERFQEDSKETVSVGEGIDEDTSIDIQAGKYRVMVEDELAGWQTETEYGEPGPVRYEYDVLELSPDKPAELTITRNFHKLAAAFAAQRQPALLRGPRTFRWHGQTFRLSHQQAFTVQVLLQALARGEPDVHEAVLLRGGMVQGSRAIIEPMSQREADSYLEVMAAAEGHSLRRNFEDGEHPEWGTLVVEGEQPNTYRLAELDLDEPIEEPAPADVEGAATSSSPTPVIAPLRPGQFERAGQLTIDIGDDGFLVAVRRKSAFDGDVPGSEQQVSEVGSTYLRVHPGEYEVLIRDKLFGWGNRVKTVTVGESDYPTITVKRDLAAYSQDVPDQTADFFWDGERYAIRSRYGRYLVSRLLRAFAVGSPDVEADTLLKELLAERDKGHKGLPERLDLQPYQDEPLEEIAPHFFPGPLGAPSNVWGKLIVPGQAEGTYRLARLDRGTIEVTDVAPGMVVTVERIEPDQRFSRRQLFTDDELEVPPGEYRHTLQDNYVGWGQWQPNAKPNFGSNQNHVRTGTIRVATGESVKIEADRRWKDYVNPPSPTESNRRIAFMWFPKYEPGDSLPHVWGVSVSTSSPDTGIDNFDVRQFRVLRELLRAFAKREPEVAERELLQRANVDANFLIDVFPEDGGGYGGRWKTIIIPGETAGTWRLKPPPESDKSE